MTLPLSQRNRLVDHYFKQMLEILREETGEAIPSSACIVHWRTDYGVTVVVDGNRDLATQRKFVEILRDKFKEALDGLIKSVSQRVGHVGANAPRALPTLDDVVRPDAAAPTLSSDPNDVLAPGIGEEDKH